MWEIILIALVILLIIGAMKLPQLFKTFTGEMGLTTPLPEDTCVLCEKKIDELIPEYENFKNKYENGIYKHFGSKMGYSLLKRLKVYQGATSTFGGDINYPICDICGLCIEKLYGKWWHNSTRIGWASDFTKQVSKKGVDLEPGKKLLEDLKSDLSGLRKRIADYKPQFELTLEEETEKYHESIKYELSRAKNLHDSIISLLKDKNIKMPPSDIDAFLKHQDVDEIKELCEQMYQDGEISYAGNGRYFILTEEQEKPKKTSASKSESTEIPEQIKKLSDLKDQGILTEEEFQSKKKDLLDKM